MSTHKNKTFFISHPFLLYFWWGIPRVIQFRSLYHHMKVYCLRNCYRSEETKFLLHFFFRWKNDAQVYWRHVRCSFAHINSKSPGRMSHSFGLSHFREPNEWVISRTAAISSGETNKFLQSVINIFQNNEVEDWITMWRTPLMGMNSSFQSEKEASCCNGIPHRRQTPADQELNSSKCRSR